MEFVSIKNKAVVFIILGSLLSLTSFARITGNAILFCGSKNNDLYTLLIKVGFEVKRYNSSREAIELGGQRSPVFIVAGNYPDEKTKIDPRWLQLAKEKEMRLYIEYPRCLARITNSGYSY